MAGVLLWAVVLRDRTPRHAWLALGLFVVSPAAVSALADHYLVDPVAYAFLAGVLLLLQHDRLILAAALCLVGLLDKEPVLFAAIIALYAVLAPPPAVLGRSGPPAVEQPERAAPLSLPVYSAATEIHCPRCRREPAR